MRSNRRRRKGKRRKEAGAPLLCQEGRSWTAPYTPRSQSSQFKPFIGPAARTSRRGGKRRSSEHFGRRSPRRRSMLTVLCMSSQRANAPREPLGASRGQISRATPSLWPSIQGAGVIVGSAVRNVCDVAWDCAFSSTRGAACISVCAPPPSPLTRDWGRVSSRALLRSDIDGRP
jgi:hypothetical protein